MNNFHPTEFDIDLLDARFHLKHLLPRLFLRAPLGVPSWDRIQKKILLNQALTKNSQISYSEAIDNFEKTICREIGMRFCIGTSSGRDAIKISLLAMGLKSGDRVILPDFCCLSVLIPILELGLVPVVADITRDLQLDINSVQRIMKSGDKVLVVPHLFGGLGPMEGLVRMAHENGTMVIDDAAQAIGVRYSSGYAGSGGDCGILSFGLFKPVSAMGGGAFITNDEQLYYRAKALSKNAIVEDLSALSILKIYCKTVWRHRTFVLFLIHRLRQQQGASREPMKIPTNRKLGTISKLDALLVASFLKKTIRDRKRMKDSAVHFASRLDEFSYLKPLIQKTAVGFPRWPAEFVDSHRAKYLDFFKYMLTNGIEVQPAYRPLHKYIQKFGMTLEGEYKTSLDLYNKVVCFPFDSKKNDQKILSTLGSFSTKILQKNV